MAVKTNTPPNPETQDRIRQLKLGVDWHVEHFRVVRMCDGQSPQPAQRFTPASFLPFVQKQLTLADQVCVVYEAGPGGFHLHRQLTALGVTVFVLHPVKLDPQHKGVVTDKTDARELALKLDRYLGGKLKAMSVVRVPTAAEEQRRAVNPTSATGRRFDFFCGLSVRFSKGFWHLVFPKCVEWRPSLFPPMLLALYWRHVS
jgi:hypothetical protein